MGARAIALAAGLLGLASCSRPQPPLILSDAASVIVALEDIGGSVRWFASDVALDEALEISSEQPPDAAYAFSFQRTLDQLGQLPGRLIPQAAESSAPSLGLEEAQAIYGLGVARGATPGLDGEWHQLGSAELPQALKGARFPIALGDACHFATAKLDVPVQTRLEHFGAVGDSFYGWNDGEVCAVVSRASGALSIVKGPGYPGVDQLWPPSAGAVNWVLTTSGQLRAASDNFHQLAASVTATVAGYAPGDAISFVDLGANGLVISHRRTVSLIRGGVTRTVITGAVPLVQPKVLRAARDAAVVVGVGASVLRISAATSTESVPWPNAPGVVEAYAIGSDGTEWIAGVETTSVHLGLVIFQRRPGAFAWTQVAADGMLTDEAIVDLYTVAGRPLLAVLLRRTQRLVLYEITEELARAKPCYDLGGRSLLAPLRPDRLLIAERASTDPLVPEGLAATLLAAP